MRARRRRRNRPETDGLVVGRTEARREAKLRVTMQIRREKGGRGSTEKSREGPPPSGGEFPQLLLTEKEATSHF